MNVDSFFIWQRVFWNGRIFIWSPQENKHWEIAGKVHSELEKLYGERLRGVYLYGSAARDQLTPSSDIDIAIVLDEIKRRFEEYERTGHLASEISLQYNTLVCFFFVPQSDYEQGKYATYRAIKREGIAV